MTSASDTRAAGPFVVEDFAAEGFDRVRFGAAAFAADVFGTAGFATLAADRADTCFTNFLLDFFAGI